MNLGLGILAFTSLSIPHLGIIVDLSFFSASGFSVDLFFPVFLLQFQRIFPYSLKCIGFPAFIPGSQGLFP